MAYAHHIGEYILKEDSVHHNPPVQKFDAIKVWLDYVATRATNAVSYGQQKMLC